ncbi:Ubiquinone biosynthesis O-methyltransferase [Rhynchospora pubera]|uniref:Ubiquinone biosynthesis O-methyltransferase n=1 Tax=Rhynchospora pubera TaxID=906938 RepID=A0AAV8DQN0_9POAL|nr:Ubiquinone biosynthesis O-methyltransferase [Rhynchospora pubera]
MALCARAPAAAFPKLREGSRRRTRCRASEAAVPVAEEGRLERPRWSGETPLSKMVGALISFKPLYNLMKVASRQIIISTAEKANVPWRVMSKEILESNVYQLFDELRNPNLVYPDYYLNPFHAYEEGNLSWLAASEAEAATMSIAKRAIPDASSIEEATQRVRGPWLSAIENRHLKYSGNKCEIKDILDIGCSVGVSSRFLAEKFPSASVVGLDLSPYFLAVAEYRQRKEGRKKQIRWVHANGEATGLPAKSFDLVSLAYVCHECPARAIVELAKEAFRVLRPSGTIAITDNSPKSKVLQELSPVLFTLLKSTEPFLDEYYLLDLEEALRSAGFVNVTTILTTPRHRTVTATVPFDKI